MSYNLVYPGREVTTDFYYVAFKSDISCSELIGILKFDVDIYNIIILDSLKIFIVNSEYQMEILRNNLSNLFEPNETFDTCGEGYSIELCLENILPDILNMP